MGPSLAIGPDGSPIIAWSDDTGGNREIYVRRWRSFAPPVADFSASPTSGLPPLTVEFTNLSTGDFDTCSWLFGDGGTSTGKWHESMNFAGVFKLPVVLVCQNNQYAQSTPIARQTRSETIAEKALAYGMQGIQVDGNDVWSVFEAIDGDPEVDGSDAGGGVDAAGLVGRLDRDLVLGASPTFAQQRLGLVGRDRYEPRPEMGLITDVAELPPGDEPCCLCRLLGQAAVAGDVMGDPPHVVVVFDDDLLESHLVTGSRRGEQARPRSTP